MGINANQWQPTPIKGNSKAIILQTTTDVVRPQLRTAINKTKLQLQASTKPTNQPSKHHHVCYTISNQWKPVPINGN